MMIAINRMERDAQGTHQVNTDAWPWDSIQKYSSTVVHTRATQREEGHSLVESREAGLVYRQPPAASHPIHPPGIATINTSRLPQNAYHGNI